MLAFHLVFYTPIELIVYSYTPKTNSHTHTHTFTYVLHAYHRRVMLNLIPKGFPLNISLRGAVSATSSLATKPFLSLHPYHTIYYNDDDGPGHKNLFYSPVESECGVWCGVCSTAKACSRLVSKMFYNSMRPWNWKMNKCVYTVYIFVYIVRTRFTMSRADDVVMVSIWCTCTIWWSVWLVWFCSMLVMMLVLVAGRSMFSRRSFGCAAL